MKILITGSNGFIGSHLVRRLKQDNPHVVYAPPSDELNILDHPKEIKRHFDEFKPDVVVNLAARIPYGDFFSTTPEIMMVNAHGVLNLANVCKEVGIEHFIHTSSMAVYGSSRTKKVDEHSWVFPDNLYGVSKLASEKILELFWNHFRSTIFRLSDVYGPNGRQERLIETVMKKISNDETIIVDREQYRNNYVYIDDVIEYIIKAIESDPKELGDLYNIGGYNYSMEDIIKTIGRAMDKDPKVHYVINRDNFVFDMDSGKAEAMYDHEPMHLYTAIKLMLDENNRVY